MSNGGAPDIRRAFSRGEEEKMDEISSVILCGGRSSRMGRDKARLPWNGTELLDDIAGRLSVLGKVFLSADRESRFSGKPYPVVEDRYPNCGPLGGICSALPVCGTPLLFVVSCDMPFVTGEVGRKLQGSMDRDDAAVVPRESDGRIHPLCAVYRKDALPMLLERLQAGNLRMRDALRCLRTVYVPAADLPGGSRVLCNINTPEEYRKVSQLECGRI